MENALDWIERCASLKGEPFARRIGRHHGKRHCHLSLECLRGTVLLTDLLVPQGHLRPTDSKSSLGLPPERRTSSERRIRLDSGNCLAFAERSDCVDICLCQNGLRNEMRDGRRRLGEAGGCLGSGSFCCRVGHGLSEG